MILLLLSCFAEPPPGTCAVETESLVSCDVCCEGQRASCDLDDKTCFCQEWASCRPTCGQEHGEPHRTAPVTCLEE